MGHLVLMAILPILTGIAWSTPADPTHLAIAPETLRVGEQTTMSWTDAEGIPLVDARAVAIYRPGSRVCTTEEIGRLSSQGQLAWRPKTAGLVRLRVEEPDGTVAVRDVSVRFARVPGAGILVLIAAGMILVVGFLAGWLRRRSTTV